jgi:hypothetical protein
MKYIVTATAFHGLHEMIAAYDPVYDSIVLLKSSVKKEDYYLFDSKQEAEKAISGYSSFQRYLSDFKIEEYQ